MATPVNLNPTLPTPPRNWFDRNWKWAVPAGILILALVLGGFVASILFVVETSFQHSGFYSEALTRARANPQVVDKIGRPIAAGWLASGSVNVSGSSGKADLSIPVSGPKGKGTIYVVANKSASVWTFETLQVGIDGEAERIDLLAPEGTPPSEP